MENKLLGILNNLSGYSQQIDISITQLINDNASKELSAFLLFDEFGKEFTWHVGQLLKRRYAGIRDHFYMQYENEDKFVHGVPLLRIESETKADEIITLKEELGELLEKNFAVRLGRFQKQEYGSNFSNKGIGVTLTTMG